MALDQYPPNPSAYKLIDEIGAGVSAIVYKAVCIPNSTLVAVKSIDLDRSRTDFDNIRLETKTMSLLSHPNILRAHCSFTVDSRLWVVMPFMSGGSLQSIISSAFPDGLPEPCIALVLRETLKALSYLHNQGHLHRDIKAGNILMDSNGQIKLADFGVSASIYEPPKPSQGQGQCRGLQAVPAASGLMLTDVTGTPYWMAPEVIHSHRGYSFKADIWSFGITALELAHGRPPLSHLPPSKSLLVKITKRFRFSDHYENRKQLKSKRFSKAFKDMVASCLDQDPSKRPSAERLLKCSFFKNCSNKGLDFLVKNLLNGLPSVEQRFKESKVLNEQVGKDDVDDDSVSWNVKTRRISGWNFNEDGFELDPVFPTESGDESVVKQVRFGGETLIKDKKTESLESIERGESGESSRLSSPGWVGELGLGSAHSESRSGDRETWEGNIDKDVMVGGLMALKSSLDEQKCKVTNLIGLLGGETTKEEQLMQVVERLKLDLENERQKNLTLEMELEFLKVMISGAYNGDVIDF